MHEHYLGSLITRTVDSEVRARLAEEVGKGLVNRLTCSDSELHKTKAKLETSEKRIGVLERSNKNLDDEAEQLICDNQNLNRSIEEQAKLLAARDARIAELENFEPKVKNG